MFALTLDEAIQAIGAEQIGQGSPPGDFFPPVSIDTRSIQPKEAFFAIKGSRFDGHQFVDDALSKGASIVVASDLETLPERWSDRTLLRVENTTAALQTLAHYVRMYWAKPVLAITGSMGKTTTRVFTTTLLSQRFHVLQSPSNFNNEFGVPLALLRLQKAHEMAVIEAGMNHPGEIRNLGKICRPDAALITNVAPVHLEFFESVDEISRAKEEILETLRQDGVFYANVDDPRVRDMSRRFHGDTVLFGFDDSADFQVTWFEFQSPSVMAFEIKTPDRYFRSSVPFVGKHLLYNIAAAVAVAEVNRLSWEEIDAGLSLLRTLPKRGQLLNLKDFAVWDESYNSNPVAARCLLETVEHLRGYDRIILTLGDMLELGKDSPTLHFELGQRVASLSPDLLLTVGSHSEQIRTGAIKSGMPAASCFHFESADQAADFLQENLRSRDLLVLKGSRGIQLDRIVDRIRRERI